MSEAFLPLRRRGRGGRVCGRRHGGGWDGLYTGLMSFGESQVTLYNAKSGFFVVLIFDTLYFGFV